jgi:hypothetical protein
MWCRCGNELAALRADLDVDRLRNEKRFLENERTIVRLEEKVLEIEQMLQNRPDVVGDVVEEAVRVIPGGTVFSRLVHAFRHKR